MRTLAAVLGVLLLVSCGARAGSTEPIPTSPGWLDASQAVPDPPVAHGADAAPAPGTAPAVPRKLRVFVVAEGPYSGGTGEVYVLEGSAETAFEVVKRIPQGGWPHQASVSPDAKYVAVANRSSNQVSIIDPREMREVARIPVGRTPHGITWSPDSRYLYVAHERDTYIGRIEVGTWKVTPLMVGVSQHLTATNPKRQNELWFTVTNSSEPDHLRIYDLETNKVTKIKVQDVHDAFFTPDGSEVWSSSSGFLDKPSDRIVIYDPETRQIKQELRLPGRYPFHAMRTFRDGQYFLPDPSIIVLTSHYSAEKGRNGASLLWVDWKARKIVADTPVGMQPFHETYDPTGDRILVTSNVDGMVNVISVKTKQVVQKVPVPKPHGIVAIGLD